MKNLIRYFFQGLLLAAPIVITFTLVRWMIATLGGVFSVGDSSFIGLLTALVLLTALGYLTSNFVGRELFRLFEELIERTPGIKILYTAIRDLLEAFVGEKKRFDRPVIVDLDASGQLKALGFMTGDSSHVGVPEGFVTVYLPQSYNVAGNLLLVPRERVHPIAVDSTELMTFVMSGGVAGAKDQPSSDSAPSSAGSLA